MPPMRLVVMPLAWIWLSVLELTATVPPTIVTVFVPSDERAAEVSDDRLAGGVIRIGVLPASPAL